MSKFGKITIIAVIAVLFVVAHISTFFVGGKLVSDFAFNPKLGSTGMNVQDNITNDYLDKTDQEFKLETEWYNQTEKTLVKIETHDGLESYAVKILNTTSTNKWALLLHGYRGGIGMMSSFAKNYYEKGYNLILPSLRGHALSESKNITFGWFDRLDMLVWINEILEIDPNAQIVMHGISMGGSTVMMTTGEDLPENVKVAVSDCGYSSVYDEFHYLATDYLGIGATPILSATDFYAKKRLGVSIKQMSAVKQLENSITPTLFIHGGADTFVPTFMIDKNFDAAVKLIDGDTKQKLVVDEAVHGMSASVDEIIYWNTVWNFIGRFVV